MKRLPLKKKHQKLLIKNETFAKHPLLPNFCVPDERDLTIGSNFNPQNTQCMDACPDFIGVVNPPEADRLS